MKTGPFVKNHIIGGGGGVLLELPYIKLIGLLVLWDIFICTVTGLHISLYKNTGV